MVDIETSNLKFTHTPADLWETLNAHTHIAGLGERNNERLQLKTLTAIAGIVNATVKNVVEDTVKNGKKHGWEYVCAVINDCSQHVESLDSIISLISSEPGTNIGAFNSSLSLLALTIENSILTLPSSPRLGSPRPRLASLSAPLQCANASTQFLKI